MHLTLSQNNEDQFIKRLQNILEGDTSIKRRLKKDATEKPKANIYLTGKSLIEEFKTNAEKIYAEIIECNVEEVADIVKNFCKEYKKEEIVSWRDSQFSLYGLSNWLEIEVQIWPIKNKVWLENTHLKLGITCCDLALAESGTVVLMSNSGRGRTVSLLPEIHLVIIRENQIVHRMTEAMTHIEKQNIIDSMPSCVNFITGPSNSADIEMNLIVGVHGPLRTIYILVKS